MPGSPPPGLPRTPRSHLAEVLDVEEVKGAEEPVLREPKFVGAGGQEGADVPQAQELWWHRVTVTSTITIPPISSPIVTPMVTVTPIVTIAIVVTTTVIPISTINPIIFPHL